MTVVSGVLTGKPGRTQWRAMHLVNPGSEISLQSSKNQINRSLWCKSFIIESPGMQRQAYTEISQGEDTYTIRALL